MFHRFLSYFWLGRPGIGTLLSQPSMYRGHYSPAVFSPLRFYFLEPVAHLLATISITLIRYKSPSV
ncbi:unnamed protein product [Periconia digitata]|uniref:Uncharacterized protein n=1 Tax=Periconia digitata TaxID=1303443 RepID=A0A9W4UT14_9PLEO|nr:unnamed protein product [Periconia digitata]